MLSPDKLHGLFNYDPVTGMLVRKSSTKGYSENRIISRKTDRGYLVTTIHGKTYKVHHLVWCWHGNQPVKELDHINRNRLDNRIENLRICTRTQNLGNSGPKNGKYKGITFCKQTGKWKAQIGVNYKNINLGRYSTVYEAVQAYNKAAIDAFGEFAYLNEVTL